MTRRVGPVTGEQYMADLDAAIRRQRLRHDTAWILDERATFGWSWSSTDNAPRDIPDLLPPRDRGQQTCEAVLLVTPGAAARYRCARRTGHRGRHAAGTGVWITAVWSDQHGSALDLRAGVARPCAAARPAGGAS